MTLTRLSMTLWVITRSTSRSCPPSCPHEHCHVEIFSDSDQKSWDNVTEDGNPRFSTTMSNVLHVHVGPPHNGQRRAQTTNPVWDSNVTFDDDPQLEASTRYGSKPT
jgi:hypothetical protein